jgi:putative PIN family toxin of toxin-antitoxin system
MSIVKIVLDTNCLLQCISRNSVNKIILDKLISGDYDLYLTNEILMEYEEKIADIFSSETAELIISFLSVLENVKKIDIHYHLNLITTDPDDNKFVDCAFASNVHYLVTNDKHYNKLKSVTFPIINIISLVEFKNLLDS